MDVREKKSNEKRLIDADRAMEIVRNQGIAHPNAYHLTNYATLILREAPTVDAVEVVRCRECKHFRHYGKTSLFINGKNIKAGWCQRRISYDEEYRMTADDFCSYGERKEGAD